ncbi:MULTISPECIES: DUF4328 domain-containing protein [unclassified Nocardioides]|uniref:DUF4328 domain-containing protein n=1 Tax=unclassified Nocardioides TaxID=2615069 RepID=UPI00301561E3
MSNPYQPPTPYGEPYPAQPYAEPLPALYAGRLSAPTGLAAATITLAVVLTLLQLATTALQLTTNDVEDDRIPVLLALGLTAVLTSPALVAAWVVTAWWLHVCRSNVDQIGPPMTHARSPVWVWLGWVVPVVSFWFPYQLVRDVQDAGRRERRATPLGLWWTGWIVYLVFSQPDSSAVAAVIASAGLLTALVPWILLVRRLTEDQRRLVQLR